MSAPLRPLTTGELLDRTFHLYRNNFVLFAGIAALAALLFVAGLVLLLALGFTLPAPMEGSDPRAMFIPIAIYLGLLGLFLLIGTSLATGATVYAVSKVHLGQPGSIHESYGKVFPKIGRLIVIVLSVFLRMLGMLVLAYLAMIPIGILAGLIVAASRGNSVVDTIIMVVIIIAAVVMVYGLAFRVYLKYSLAVHACMLENTRINDSLRRSAFLTQGALWRLFLITLLMGVIAFALNLALSWPGELLLKPASIVGIVWPFLATFVAYSISFPISTIAIALAYYDQRVRKEALDLQLMMDSVDQAPQAAAIAAP